MQHLDEGILMALLDGELTGPEQLDVESHLRACPECSAQLVELKGFMAEADDLVVALGDPPAQSIPAAATTGAPHRRFTPRTLAWAASIVAAIGLGFAGSTLMKTDIQEANFSAGSPPPSTPSEVAIQQERATEPTPQAEAPSPANTGAISSRGPAETTTRAATDSISDGRRNEALALRSDEREADQSAGLAPGRDQVDLADLAAKRDSSTPTPSAEVTTGASSQARVQEEARASRQLAPAAPAAGEGFRRMRLAVAPFQRVSMEEAVRQLSGAIRLIDGLSPEEFEVTAGDSAKPVVRVLYRVGPTESPLYLVQQRTDNSFVASDLQALQPAVEQVTTGNRLYWNDLRGFLLTLTGPFSTDSLFHFKTLVK
jgi:hypothetical protein